MTTITRAPKTAVFYSNLSNARRALKKVYACDTAEANALIHMEAPEEGGRYWFDEKVVNALANPQVEADKATIVELPAAPKASKARSVTQNGVRRPIKGLCADVWNTLDEMRASANSVPTIHDVKALAEAKSWNINNATIEFYGWRKFHGLNTKGTK